MAIYRCKDDEIEFVNVNKKEFKLIYKSLKALTKLVNKYLSNNFINKLDVLDQVNVKLSTDISSFKQAWNSVRKGISPIYSIIHIDADRLATITTEEFESGIATAMFVFTRNNSYTKIIDKINYDKPVGRRKDRFKAVHSFKWPYFCISIRGDAGGDSNNMRIIIKSEHVFQDVSKAPTFSDVDNVEVINHD